MIIDRPDKWSAVGGVLPNPVEYTIQSSLAVVTLQLFISGILLATVRQRTRDGQAIVDVSAFLRSLLQPTDETETFPVNLPADRVEKKTSATLSYYIKYFDDSNTLISDESQIRYASRSALQALSANITQYLIADTSPVYEFDLTTIECKQAAPRSTSATLAKLKDVNPLSLTYNQYKTPGDYAGDLFDFNQDATLCPIEIIDTSPNWQPVLATIKCEQDDAGTRTNSRRVAKVIDTNPNSIYYNQYGTGVEATTGTADINLATYYYYDNNAILCPIAPEEDPVQIDVQTVQYKYTSFPTLLRIKVRRLSTNYTQQVQGVVAIRKTVTHELQQELTFTIGIGNEVQIKTTSLGLNTADQFEAIVTGVSTFGFEPYPVATIVEEVEEFTI